jgi:hypothetical protein
MKSVKRTCRGNSSLRNPSRAYHITHHYGREHVMRRGGVTDARAHEGDAVE